VQSDICAESGRDFNCSWASWIVVERDQQTGCTQTLMREQIEILPTLEGWSCGELLVNPNQVVY
jgi:hypothetical protein